MFWSMAPWENAMDTMLMTVADWENVEKPYFDKCTKTCSIPPEMQGTVADCGHYEAVSALGSSNRQLGRRVGFECRYSQRLEQYYP